MERTFAKAVIATFRNTDVAEHKLRLQQFSARQWSSNLRWLDASGLALYFLQRIKRLGIEDAIPETMLHNLNERCSQNARRTDDLFHQLLRVNSALQKAGIECANLKGFTLVPDYCPDASLRLQVDCDVLIDRGDEPGCREALSRLGYFVVAASDRVIEFKTDVGSTPNLRDLYKAKPQRGVEVHLCDNRGDGDKRSLLSGIRHLELRGHQLPALSREDMFVLQASHVLQHLRSEWTRVSWLLEFHHFLTEHRNDEPFWRAIRERVGSNDRAALAIGVAMHVAQRIFGCAGINHLASYFVHRVPSPASLWIDCYGERAVLTEFPGNKLYLLLEQALASQATETKLFRRLVPLRAPAPVVTAPPAGLSLRLRGLAFRCRYFLFRLRFHIIATTQYLAEARRWRRFLAQHSKANMLVRSRRGLADSYLSN